MGGREEIPSVRGEGWPREEIPHALKPEARDSRREELPHPPKPRPGAVARRTNPTLWLRGHRRT